MEQFYTKYLYALKRGPVFWSVAGGVGLACAYDNIAIGFLAWFALAFLLYGLRNATVKEAFYLGLAAGFVHYLILLYWLVPTMRIYGPLPVWMAVGALLLLAFYLALYFALFSMAVAAIVRRPVFLVLAVPVFWVGLEYIKTFLFSGFPWGLLGYSQYKYLHLIQIADMFGVYGVSFFLGAINAAVFVIVLYARRMQWQNNPVSRGAAGFCVILTAALFALNAGYGSYKLPAVDRMAADAGSLKVAVVQGNIDQSLKWDDEYVNFTIDRYIDLSKQAMEFSPGLVVWPETAMPFYFLQEKKYTGRVLEGIEEMGAWFLTGSPSFEYDSETEDSWFYNTAYLVSPEARMAGAYDKVHLVPFGEYVPLGRWLPFIDAMVHSIGDFRAGETGTLLSAEGFADNPVDSVDLGVQICYEIIFPHLSAEMVKNGGNLIINITNDAWFGKTAGPRQHFSMSVFRSVENRRALVRSANTGISGFVDPAGRVTGKSGLYETTYLHDDVAVIKNKKTFYTNYTDLLPLACLAASLLIIAAAVISGKKKKKWRKI